MTVVDFVGIDLERNVDVGWVVDFNFEIRTDDTDDFITFTAQSDAPSDHLRISAKAPYPKVISQHGGFRRFRQIFFGRVRTSMQDRRATQTEKIRAGASCLNLFWRRFAGQICNIERVGRNVLEGSGLPPPKIKLGRRGSGIPSALLEEVLKVNDAIWVGKCERLQQN